MPHNIKIGDCVRMEGEQNRNDKAIYISALPYNNYVGDSVIQFMREGDVAVVNRHELEPWPLAAEVEEAQASGNKIDIVVRFNGTKLNWTGVLLPEEVS